jgi:DNA polymerase II small subunit/DNA polymerase delta subunit B
MFLELIIDLADRIHGRVIHERYIDRWLVCAYLSPTIVSSRVAHEPSDISESLLVDEVVELLHQSEDHRLGLDIWSIRELVSYGSTPESERFEIRTFLSLEPCLILLELTGDILEKIFAIPIVDELLCMGKVELIGREIL